MASVMHICKTADVHQMTIHGTIKFLQDTPTSFPKKSCLAVKFEDTSRADASAVQVANQLIEEADLKLTNGMLSYNMSFVKPTPGEYSVSAVLNMGWCSRNGDDWMHGGDYLTTTTFNVEVTAQKNLYEADIELEHYQTANHNAHNAKRDDDPCYHASCRDSICRSFGNGSYVCTKVFGVPCAMPMCSAIYEPICADNGKTYENECLMSADKCKGGLKIEINKVHDGECYAKRAMLGGFLFGSCIVLLTIVGFFAIFWIWKRNRRFKISESDFGSMKKIAPLGM